MADSKLEVKKADAPSRTFAIPDVLQSLRRDMDRLFDRFSVGSGLPALHRLFDVAPGWDYEPSLGFSAPVVDLSEDDGNYVLTAELPGIDENDVEVVMTDDMLTMTGEKKHKKEEKAKNYYVAERSYGSFRRSFALPKGVDRDKITARFAKGVLTVTLPKTAAQRERKKIEITAG